MIVGFGRIAGAAIASNNIVINVGINGLVGYKWFHTPSFGQRLYFDVSIGFIPDRSNTLDLVLNYDLLFNFVKNRGFKFGMLFGLNAAGINVMRGNSSTTTSFIILGGVNIGFRFGIFSNHSIEALAQLKALYGGYMFTSAGIRPGGSYTGILRYVHTY